MKALRKCEGIKSQSEFGKLIGVPSHNINKYENGVIPKPDILRTVATQFGINLHLFFTRELTEENYEQFKIEYNTEAKLEDLSNQSSKELEITRNDLDRVATYFGDKLQMIEEGEINEVDRQRMFGDIRSIFLSLNKKLKDFYVMQDRIAEVLGEKPQS